MIGRYTLPAMAALWSEQSRFEHMLQVELAVLRALAERGDIPEAAVETIAVAPAWTCPHRRAGAHDRPRRRGLRHAGRRIGRRRGPLPPLRAHQQRRRGHRAGPAMPRRRRPHPGWPGRCHRRCRGARPGPRRHADDGPHPRRPRRAHHLRTQAGLLGLRAGPRAHAPAVGRGRPGHGQDLRSRGDLLAASARSRGGRAGCARPRRRPCQHADRAARPTRRLPGRHRRDRRLHRALRGRDPQPPAHRDRRAPGALPERAGRLVGHAPQAQPHPRRAPHRHGPAAARLCPRGHGRPGPLARARHQPLVGRAHRAARRHDAAALHAGALPWPRRRAWSCGPIAWPTTSPPATGCTPRLGS